MTAGVRRGCPGIRQPGIIALAGGVQSGAVGLLGAIYCVPGLELFEFPVLHLQRFDSSHDYKKMGWKAESS